MVWLFLLFIIIIIHVYLAGVIFPWSELMNATEEMSETNLLGQGGFGSVYKGVLRHTTVAVKFLNKVSITKVLWCEVVFWN